MKPVLYLIVILLCPIFLSGKTVTPERAATAAVSFYKARAGHFYYTDAASVKVRSLEAKSSNDGQVLYYVVSMQPGGFVLISGNDQLIPVLGYSYTGTFSADHCNISAWMMHYEKQITFQTDYPATPDQTILNAWNELDNGIAEQSLKGITAVSPLLVSTWNQDSFYNEMCPEDPAGPEGHCYTGCVATAMGQLLNYYRFPYQGQGSYTYVHPDYGTITADFGATTYDWSGMPSSIGTSCPPLATLLFHQGVSVDMDYGPDGSGMWNHKAAYSLKTHFRYGPETRYFFRDSISLDWDSILVANLDQRKPLYYAGWAGVQSTDGHAFVCDGYQGPDYFHFNWGWGGQADGYFYLNNLNPGGANFNFAQEVIPLFPDTLQNTYPVYCSGHHTLQQVRGSVEDGSGGWYPYAANSNCSWLIDPQDPQYDSVTRLKITFTRLDTESGIDMVSIYDGNSTNAPLIGTYSGNSLPPVINSTGNKVYIVFQSDGQVQLGGWELDFEPVFPVYCTGTTTITDFSGDISDGSGDKKYNNKSICRWKILPENAAGVSLIFTGFDIPDTLDMLRVYDLGSMELLAALNGTELPDPVYSPSGKMMLLFNTNKSVTGQGWEGYFTGSYVGRDELPQLCSELRVMPVPSDGHLRINCYSPETETADVRVYSNQGIEVFRKTESVRKGDNNFLLDISFLPASSYYIRLCTRLSVLTGKAIIH